MRVGKNLLVLSQETIQQYDLQDHWTKKTVRNRWQRLGCSLCLHQPYMVGGLIRAIKIPQQEIEPKTQGGVIAGFYGNIRVN